MGLFLLYLSAMKLSSIAVFCGSSLGNDPVYGQAAEELAKFLCDKGIQLVFGGGKIGVMGALAKAALESNGKIVGVIPKFLTHKEVVHTGLTELILTENMHERKAKITELSDAYIILPGGYGTLEEFFEVLTWAQLGLHAKPIAILNVDKYFDPLIAQVQTMVDQGFLKSENQNMILISESIEDLYQQMINYVAPEVPKWLKLDQT